MDSCEPCCDCAGYYCTRTGDVDSAGGTDEDDDAGVDNEDDDDDDVDDCFGGRSQDCESVELLAGHRRLRRAPTAVAGCRRRTIARHLRRGFSLAFQLALCDWNRRCG